MSPKHLAETSRTKTKTNSSQPPLAVGARTDVGLKRSHNEDSLIVQEPLFAVADGMGGHQAGEVASEIATSTLASLAPQTADSQELSRAVVAANRAIIRGAREGKGRHGMGCTMTAAVIEGDHLVVAQVGDSRAYLLHQGRLQQITRDHSLVAHLVEQGSITPEEARSHPQRSIITRALGSDINTKPDLYELALSPGDRLLLCSDGLSGMVPDHQLEYLLKSNSDPQATADMLIDTANTNGGQDNITAIVIDVLSTGKQGKTKEKSKPSFKRTILLVVAVILALLILGFGGLFLYARSSAYLIAEDGYVVAYQGLPGEVAGLELSWLIEKTDIKVSDLNSTTAARLEEGVTVDGTEAAQTTLKNYRKEVTTKSKSTEKTANTTGTTKQDTKTSSSTASSSSQEDEE